MRRRKISSLPPVFAALCVLLFILAAPAQSMVTAAADGQAEYLDALAELMADVNRIAPEDLHGDGPLLRIAADGQLSPAQKRLSKVDRELAAAGGRLLTLYRSIGGQTGARGLLLQRTQAGLFIAREGATGTVSKNLGAAMSGALQDFAKADTTLPPIASAWVPQLAASMSRTGSPPPQNPVARLARNQRTVITLSGPEIATAGPDPILTGPRGSSIHIVRTARGQLQASVTFSEETPEGFSKLYLFRAGNALSPVADFDITVGGGARNATTAVADDHGATPQTATQLLQAGANRASLAGEFGAPDDVDMFRVNVSAPGSLAIASRGSSDVTARLLDSRGNPVASNDDGGTGYNFGIQTPVNPGNYLLSVQHCCGGGGNYHIDTSLTPE